MSDTKTITLRSPVDLDGRTFNNIDLCEPTVAQMEKAALAPTGIASNIMLVADVAKVPIGMVRAMKKRDFEEACEFLQGFRPADPRNGAGS